MGLNFKNNFLGYFKFFYDIVGVRLFVCIFLSIVVGTLDGIGLTMFIPLLQAVSGGTESKESLGQLYIVIRFLNSLGIQLNLNTVLIIIGLLFSIKGLIKFFELYYQARVQQIFVTRVQFIMVQNLREISYRGFLKLDAGKIQNTLISEVFRTSQAIRNYLRASQAVFILLTYMVLAFLANYEFALLVALSAGISNLFYKKVYKKIVKVSIDVSTKGHSINSYLIEAVHYFKYLKSTNQFVRFSTKLKRKIRETERLQKKTGQLTAITYGIREPVVVLMVVLMIYLQVNLMGGSLSSIVLSLLLFYRGLTYLMATQTEWQYFIQHTGAMHTLSVVSKEMQEMKEVKGKEEFKGLKSELALKNVSFKYDDKPVLDNINIRISKNTTIALTGTSGSGKTTLANILTGLITCSSGQYLIDGSPINGYNYDSFRSKLGYISQESVIFNDSIFNNITLWAEPNKENISFFWEVIKLASLEHFVLNQTKKENTWLGDNGIMISGGQRQRISIARELFKRPEILILDEATSSLDSETESIIQENVEKLHGAYTMIIIAHRLSTIKHADQIYLLENGKIITSGDYSDLISSSHKFKALVALQQL